MRRLQLSGLLFAAGLSTAYTARAQTVTFDFDAGTPLLSTGQNTPFDQTSGGIAAHFSSPSGAAFSVQSDRSTGWHMSGFSGNYLSDNNLNRNLLDIKFSRQITRITFSFATADFQQVEVPTTIQLTAFVDSTAEPAVGSVTAHGTYARDTMPMGALTFDSGGRPFNLVEIEIPQGQARAAADFFVDNVTVAPVTSGIFTSFSAASYAAGAALAPGSMASGFGTSLASGTEQAVSYPLPAMLADTTVNVRDSAGVERQASLIYVGPTQINYLVPEGTAMGPATVRVTSGTQVTARGSMNVDRVAPGLFTANCDGKGVPAAQAITVGPDLIQTEQVVANCGTAQGSCVPAPIDLGPNSTQVVLVLYGTGIRGRSALTAVTANIGGIAGDVSYAGAQSPMTGLDQVNIAIPRALAGQGEVELSLSVDGKVSNIVRICVK